MQPQEPILVVSCSVGFSRSFFRFPNPRSVVTDPMAKDALKMGLAKRSSNDHRQEVRVLADTATARKAKATAR